MDEKIISKNIDDKLATIKYTCDTESHLIVNQDKCRKCKKRFCTFICPANVYSWDSENKKMLVKFEDCLECGACRIACEKKNIDWKYPKAGYGVKFKLG